MYFIKTEFKVFFTALMFYTRIPCPKWVDHSEEYLNKATRYFSLMGWIVGLTSGVVFYISQLFLPLTISIILSMMSSILLTGALHEDGFADVCDGFGGGWTKEKILSIMKDSVVGAYGVIGIVLLLLLKFTLLFELGSVHSAISVVFILIAAHSTSRLGATTMIFSHEYVRENEDSKAKPVAKKLPLSSLFASIIFGIAPLFLFNNLFVWIILAPVFGVKIYLGNYFKKWIGGYTGDCLGATQQVCELTFYLAFLVIWKFTS